MKRRIIFTVIVAVVVIAFFACMAITRANGWPEKWKIFLEVALVVGFGIIIATVQTSQNKIIAKRQAKQTQNIANRHNYTTAIEHLSSNSPAVRLKGIRDLCKHNAIDERAVEIQNLFNDQVRFFTRNKDYQEINPKKPAKDIQTLLNILLNRIEEGENDFQYALMPNKTIDWSGAFLKGAYLWGANLQGAYLEDADLQGAYLRDANLQGAHLGGVDLQGAHLEDAKLQGAYLRGANLQGADLDNAKLQGVDLWDTNLQGAYLQDSDLRGVDNAIRYSDFEERIRDRTGKPTDVTGILLGDNITSKEDKEQYLKDHGAIIGKYTKEEAEQWIAEYNAARQKK